MKIVLTGSRGLLGRYLLRELTTHGHEVVEFDLLLGHDVRDRSSLTHAVRGADAVVHLASPSSSILFDVDPDACWRATLEPLHTLLEIGQGLRIVIPSSGTVYGQMSPPSREHDWLTPVTSLYARAKLESERLALHARAHGHDVSICRIFTGYGAYEHHKVGYASQVFSASEIALRGGTYDIFGDGGQSRDFVHAIDIATAFRLMLETPACPPLVNVGSGQSVTVQELVRLIRAEVGPHLRTRHVAAPSSYVAATRADLAVASSALGFQPRVSLQDGLKEVRDALVSASSSDR